MTTKPCRCSPRRSPPKTRTPPADDKGLLIRLVPTSNQQSEQLNRLRNCAAVSGDNTPEPAAVTCPGVHITQSTLHVQKIKQYPELPDQLTQQPMQQFVQQPMQQAFQQPMQQAFQPFQHSFQQPFQQAMLQALAQPIQQSIQPLQQQTFGTMSPGLCQPVQQFVPQFLPQEMTQAIPQTFVQTIPQPVHQSTIAQFVPQTIAHPVFQQMSAPQSPPVSVQNLPATVSVTAIANAIKASNDTPKKREKRKHSCCCLGLHNHCNLHLQAQNNNQPMISIPPYALLGDLMARAINPPPQPPAPSNITLEASVALPKGKGKESDSSLVVTAEKVKAKRKKKRRKKSSSSSSSSSSEHKKKKKERKEPEHEVRPEPPRELPVLPVELPEPEPMPHIARPPSYQQYEEHQHDIYQQEQIPAEYTPPQMPMMPPAVGPDVTAEMQVEQEEGNPVACMIVIGVVATCFLFCLLCVIYPGIIDFIFGLDSTKGQLYSRQMLRLDVETFIDGLQRMGEHARKHLRGSSQPIGGDTDFERYMKDAWKAE